MALQRGWPPSAVAADPADLACGACKKFVAEGEEYINDPSTLDQVGEEIKKLLNSTLEREKLEGMKHLIALISLGHDASEFFPQAVKNVVADSVELKRLVYMYLVHYAEVRLHIFVPAITLYEDCIIGMPGISARYPTCICTTLLTRLGHCHSAARRLSKR